MKIAALVIASLLLCMTTTVQAEDNMGPVFTQIDDLLTRVESGISLNSYAESLAELKAIYKKTVNGDLQAQNPLFADRMKSVMTMLDDYAYVWRGQENEYFRYVSYDNHIFTSYPEAKSCAKSENFTFVYPISCVKGKVMEQLYEKLNKAKSALYNGW